MKQRIKFYKFCIVFLVCLYSFYVVCLLLGLFFSSSLFSSCTFCAYLFLFFFFVRLLLMRFFTSFLFLSSFRVFAFYVVFYISFTYLFITSIIPSYSFVSLFSLLSFLSDHTFSDSARYLGFFLLEITLNPKKSVALLRERCN